MIDPVIYVRNRKNKRKQTRLKELHILLSHSLLATISVW